MSSISLFSFLFCFFFFFFFNDPATTEIYTLSLHDALPISSRSLSRQRLQMHARALVAAVLRPHDREDPELGQIRLAAEELHDAVVLVALQAVAFENLRIDRHDRSPERLALLSLALPRPA